jgi:hypothetical protein
MGNAVGKTMADNQREMMLKQREIGMAVAMAQTRDTLRFLGAGVATYLPLGVLAATRSRSPAPLLPLLPLSFVMAYMYDMGYGNKLTRVRSEAGEILREHHAAFRVPPNQLMITLEEYDAIFDRERAGE